MNINLNEIIIFELDFINDNQNKSGILFELSKFTNNEKNDTYIRFKKTNNKLLLLETHKLENKNNIIIEVDFEDNIKNIYIELIPFMNKHIFAIYVEIYQESLVFLDILLILRNLKI